MCRQSENRHPGSQGITSVVALSRQEQQSAGAQAVVEAVAVVTAENALCSRLLFPLHCAVVQSRWLHHLCCFRLVSPDLLMKRSLYAILLKQRWNFCPKCSSANVYFTLLFTESHMWCVREDGQHETEVQMFVGRVSTSSGDISAQEEEVVPSSPL